MFTEPQIVSTKDLKSRAYVKTYINGQRFRFYNGKTVDIACNPNHCKSIKERNRALSTLCFTIRKKLEGGWRPNTDKEALSIVNVNAGDGLISLLDDLLGQDLSDLYKRDILSVGRAFVEHLKKQGTSNRPLEKITKTTIEGFLSQFNHSATYYMNKRRTLSGIFSRLVERGVIPQNPVSKTSRLKEKATLHQAYTKDRLTIVLTELEKLNKNLHLCALLMYGCFLRPHQEVRNLFRRDLNEDCSTISLSGRNNKSKRVRTVYVPPYVREAIVGLRLNELGANMNLFTRNSSAFNESYFNTMWSRAKQAMTNMGIIDEKQTLYSFRHTGAINLYMKTKDLYKVQQAMGHSSMTVTLTYMRSLGLINNLSAEDAPDL